MDMVKLKAAELNVPIETKIITVKTAEEAIKYRHIGGPTVQINGLDIEKEARNSKYFGLC